MTKAKKAKSFESIFRGSKSYEDAFSKIQKIKSVDQVAEDGSTPLSMAAYYGHKEACRWLLENGAKIDKSNKEGMTPLASLLDSFSSGQNIQHMVDTALYLIEAGANLNAQDKSYKKSILMYAIKCNRFALLANVNLVKILIEKGADVFACTNYGATSLYEASSESDLSSVKYLLKMGVDLKSKTDWGGDAFNAAFDQHLDDLEPQRDEIIQVLFKVGPLFDGKDAGGETTLMKACRIGHVPTINSAIKKGIDVNQSSETGLTALHCAVIGSSTGVSNYSDVIQLLIKAGASCAVRDKHKRLPADMTKDAKIRSLVMP